MINAMRTGQQLADYRDKTESMKVMMGAMRPSFICRCCGQNRAIGGRKMVVSGYPKAGWKCRDCAEAGE